MESEANREKLILNTERVIASELTKTTLEKKRCDINQQFYEEISSVFCEVKISKHKFETVLKRNRKKENHHAIISMLIY